MRPLLVAALVMTSLAAAPLAAADHVCAVSQGAPEAVKLACGAATIAVHAGEDLAGIVLGYALCYYTTPPSQWLSQCV